MSLGYWWPGFGPTLSLGGCGRCAVAIEPLHNCRACGFVMHSAETDCLRCELLEDREAALKAYIAARYRNRYPHLSTMGVGA